MKQIRFSWSKRQKRLLLSCLICTILALGLHVFSGQLKNSLPHELVAEEWDSEGGTAQISVYFSETAKYSLKSSLKQTEYQVEGWYHSLLDELTQASITVDSDAHPTARLIVYGYSAAGSITAVTEHGSATVKAYGVGGDFFQFHPLKLVAGSYFSDSDLMQDKVILDTDTAWKLYGSSDIVGMNVLIDNIPHLIVGVYEREEGYLNDAAGNDESIIYVSHETLYDHGSYYGLESLEYLIPNPVTDFAYNLVKDQLTSYDVGLVENSGRYDFLSLLEVIKGFGTRSMGLSGITFPYWENIARGYEDILACILFFELLLAAYVIITLIAMAWYMWLHRSWRAYDLYEKGKDWFYALSVKRHKEKLKKAKKSEQKKSGEDDLDEWLQL